MQETETIADMASCEEFLLKGLKFNLQPNLLGICTSFRERVCYRENSISFKGARLLATLLGLLVDAPKQGYRFTETMWQNLLSNCSDLPNSWPPAPAYKVKKDVIATGHIIDQLLLVKAKEVIEDSMKDFFNDFMEVQSVDDDLTRVWKKEYYDLSIDAEVKRVLNQLLVEVRVVKDYWKDNVSGDEDTQQKDRKFAAVVEYAHAQFSQIMPSPSTHPLVLWWAKDANRCSDSSFWSHLKASHALYKNGKSTFPWYVAGKHLGELKAFASRGYHTVITDMYISYKLDPAYIRRVESKRPILEKVDEPLEDDGVWE